MVQFGYALSSEEHPSLDLVRNAKRAEELGFTFALISDHFHPWIDAQGYSPFVWSILGAIAQATERLQIGTGVTCPLIRTHPGIIAQAAATMAALMPGRFFLGVGTGENLNEHIFGDHWPPFELRIEMLSEAVDLMRLMWEGENISYYGEYYTVENARIYTLPDEPPLIMMAAAGETAAQVAAEIADGLISTAPEQKIVDLFEQGSEGERPKYGKFTCCWANSRDEAIETVYKIWPVAGVQGELMQELPTPTHFEQASKMVRKEDVAESIVCGNNPQEYIKGIQGFIDAGYDNVYLHQIGHDQEGFFQFWQKELAPHFK